MNLDWKVLYKTLNKKRKDIGCSWRHIAGEISVTPSTFTRISKGKPVSVKNLVRMLSWLGDWASLAHFTKG